MAAVMYEFLEGQISELSIFFRHGISDFTFEKCGIKKETTVFQFFSLLGLLHMSDNLKGQNSEPYQTAGGSDVFESSLL